jgi:hypothetical protein
MKITEILQENNVYSLKTGKQVKPEKVSMKQAFGHPIANSIEDLGVKFEEKPDYWEDLRDVTPVDDLVLRKVSKFLQSEGQELNTYTAKQIFGKDDPYGPTSRTVFIPDEIIFIVNVPEFGKFLANKHGAQSYIRNWAPIFSR